MHNGEAVGVIMGLDLLISFTRQLCGPTIIGCDNQAVLRGLTNQKPHSGHYLLDIIHDLEERLHAKQDGLAQSAKEWSTYNSTGYRGTKTSRPTRERIAKQS